MLKPFTGFVGGSYTLRSISAECQRTVNLYPEVNESGAGKSVASLISTPGLTLLSVLGDGANRGLYSTSKGRSFAVSGMSLYEITNPSVPIPLGSLISSTGTVSMSDNGVDLIAVDGFKGYTFRFATNVFSQISDTDFPTANYVAFQDQYLIVNDANTGNFFLSGLSDAPDWDGLDFAAAEGSPDNLKTLVVDHEQLLLVGDFSTEVWVDTGNADFPFERVSGGYLEFGTPAPDSVLKVDSTVMMVSQDLNGNGIVMRVQGINGQRVSNYGVEYALSLSTDISNASAWSYCDAGHTFYCLSAPGLTSTWCFDLSTGIWHERQSKFSRHRAQNHCVIGGIHVVGDYQNGNLYQLSNTEATDNLDPKIWTRRAPHISSSTQQVAHKTLIVDMETGTAAADEAPQVSLRYSNDGGHTFGSERWTSAGLTGEYRLRAKWERLGQARDRVYEVSGQGNVTITAAYLDAQAGIH